ncbi:MAG: hypothetical protein J7457_17100 [Roseiflexus sp.]|nr:hypothetical protein [Roseiflexus sp.]
MVHRAYRAHLSPALVAVMLIGVTLLLFTPSASAQSAPPRRPCSFDDPSGWVTCSPYYLYRRPRELNDVYFTRYYPETRHNLYLPFLKYWDRMGGLPVFGYPISEAFLEQIEGRWYMVQYFERQRFEWHYDPDNPDHHRETDLSKEYWLPLAQSVRLGRLGVEALSRQGRDWRTFPKGDPAAPHFFQETGHAIAPEFWGYWSSHGLEMDGRPGFSRAESLALFGYPISEAQVEHGRLTQWFERARFEYFPEFAGTPYVVQLGLLGRELAEERSGEEPFLPTETLSMANAARQRMLLASGQALQRPLKSRPELQAAADQVAAEWSNVFFNGGDVRKSMERIDATYASMGNYLAPSMWGIHPHDPIGGIRNRMRSNFSDDSRHLIRLTIGVYGPVWYLDTPVVPMVFIPEWE